MISLTVRVRQRSNAGAWLNRFEKAAGPMGIKVGLPAGKAPGSVIRYAIWNHFGTAGSGKGFSVVGLGGKKIGGFGGPIPPRPFITVAVFKHRAQIRRALRALYHDMLRGRITSETAAAKLGQLGVDIIKATIASGVGPKNAPLTVAIKGSNKQLIASGRMLNSITWALDASGASTGMRRRGSKTRLYGKGKNSPQWKTIRL